MALRKIKLNSYLKKFVDFCKQRYNKKIIAIGIYGSYAWGYFDKEKSDYDVFLIFKSKVKDEREILMSRLEKIAVQYFCSSKDLLKLIKEGHWSLYITFLTSARMLYYTKDYKSFINKLRKINFISNLKDTKRIEWKAKFDTETIKKSNGYDGIKYALPALRSRLQLLTYIKHQKLIWDLNEIIKLNSHFLSKEEKKLLIELDKSVKQRKNNFSVSEKNNAIRFLRKINNKIISLMKINAGF